MEGIVRALRVRTRGRRHGPHPAGASRRTCAPDAGRRRTPALVPGRTAGEKRLVCASARHAQCFFCTRCFMRVVATLAFLTAVAFSIVPPSTAQGAESQELPHAFPRAGATMLLDNQWGTVWDATYEPGKPTPLHRHRFDFVAVELTDTTL